MRQRESFFNDRESWDDPRLLYGAVLVLISGVMGYWLWPDTSMTWAMILPVLAMALVFSRLRILAVMVPVMVYFVLGLADFVVVGGGARMHSGSVPLGISSLVLIVISLRYQMFIQASLPAGTTTSQLPHSPAHRDDASHGHRRNPSSFRIHELASLMMIPLAWVISASLIDQLSGNLDDAVVDYGLLPQGLLVVKLSLALCATFLICQSLLAYGRWVTDDRHRASMHLRQEIWNWSRREQRLVARGKRRYGAHR